MPIRNPVFLFLAVIILILAGCAPAVETPVTPTDSSRGVVETAPPSEPTPIINTDEAAATVATFIEALVNKDADTLSTLACADWEDGALRELDSFQAVNTRLNELDCQVTGTEGDSVLVVCQGQIIATYNNEDSNFELGARTYLVAREGGEWRVCGYR